MESINKFILFILVSFLMATVGFSQQTMIYGYQGDDESYFNSLPQMVLTPQSAATTLPSEVDNSQQIYFPRLDNNGLYDQTGTGSCVYVASIFYAYAYEYNRLKGLAGNTAETRFAPNSLYNHINGGQPDVPSDFTESLPLMQEYGVASENVWGNLEPLDYIRWQSGYDSYHQRLLHRIKEPVTIKVNYSIDDLIPLKHYLNDHNEGGTSIGGVVSFGSEFWGPIPSTLTYPSAYPGQKVKINIVKNTASGHAVTIVGYCDNVKYDVNGDGLFTTNEVDVNLDGIKDLRDCEIGAFKVVNNYGFQSNDGFDWVLYRCLYDTPLYTITPENDYSPLLELKVKINHIRRSMFVLKHQTAGKANVPSPPFPGGWPVTTVYKLSSPNSEINSEPPYPMRGAIYNPLTQTYTNDFEPIEYTIDETKAINSGSHVGKFLILAQNQHQVTPENKLINYSLIDYRWNEVFELECEQHDVQFAKPATHFSIEYDLIPHESPITTATAFSSNMVSRFSPVFTGNQTYTIGNDVRFDMYNSTITLEQGSSLSLGNNVIIRGKRGTNKFVIKGNILPMGTNVKFEAEPGSTLEVIYENPTVAGLLDKCVFNNANLTAQGGTLTVKNSTFTLLPSNKVIVKPNAKLILDASLLTKSGPSQWQGIEVWGNSNQHQQTISGQCAQGTIELTNNTIIENAYNGITNWKPNDWNSIGGIIKATGATLRNNRRSVEFMKYRNFDPANGQEIDNLSSFYGCTFEINDQYPAGAAPYYTQVSLWYVKGVKFHGCDFLNNRTNNYTGYGIYSLDAGYKILALPITPIVRPIFQNFENGIYASNSETSNTIYVNYGKFTNNGKGISLLSVNNAVVLNSLFEIGISTSCPNQGVGISMNSCTGYSIEQNTFTGGTITPGRTFAGIDITNSGIAYNEIYKNIFQNLNYGNMANQVNGTSNTLPPTGLTYLCNQNSGNKNDFYVTNNSRIALFQRSGSAGAAANTFSNNAIYNFYNGGSVRISYNYSSGQAPFSYYNLLLVPTSVTNGCVAHYGDGNGDLISMSETQIEEKEQQYAEAFSAYNNVKAIYESLKDGGSTANTVEEITTSIPSEMWELRTKLIGDSPHLSQISLKEASLKTDVLPESVLFDILASNPDEMKDEEFLDFLQTKESPLPDYMIDLLREISGNTSYKTILQEQLNMYDIQKTTAANDVLRSVLHDTVFDQTAVFSWLDNKGDLASQYQMVDLCLQNGNTTAAQAILSTIPGLFQLTESELSDYQNFNTVKSIQLNLKNSGRNLLMLDTAEIVSLTTIANTGKGIASAQAKGILGFAIGNQYCQCTPDEEGLKHSEVKIPGSAGILSKIEINASPNPATNWVAFDYLLPENETSASLILTDITGKTVETLILNGQQGQKVWDTRDIKSGTYIYSLKVASYTKTGKIVITK